MPSNPLGLALIVISYLVIGFAVAVCERRSHEHREDELPALVYIAIWPLVITTPMSTPRHPPDAPPFTVEEIVDAATTLRETAGGKRFAAMLDHYAAVQAQGTCETCKFADKTLRTRQALGEDKRDKQWCDQINYWVPLTVNSQPFGCRGYQARPAAPGAQP